MDFGERMRRGAGWACLALVAGLISMGYHFGNIRFAPVAAGFAIFGALCLMQRGSEQVSSDAIHPGTDPRVGGTGGR